MPRLERKIRVRQEPRLRSRNVCGGLRPRKGAGRPLGEVDIVHIARDVAGY